MFERRARGLSLGTVLMVLVVAATCLFALASVALSHYQMVVGELSRGAARAAARSAASLAIARVKRDQSFGRERRAEDDIQVELGGTRPSTGRVSFQAEGSYSTNNLGANAQSAGSDGYPVPRDTVHIVAVGRCRGVEQRVVVYLHVPSYPWALAANGPLQLAGGTRVAGLHQLPQAGQVLTEDDLTEANLRSNGTSILLGKGSEVRGDVEAVGEVHFQSGANVTIGPQQPQTPEADTIWVHGEVKTGESTKDLLSVDFAQYDPSLQGLGYSNLSQVSYDGVYTVRDTRRREGNLSFPEGLSMEGGLLFVDGDLTVGGEGLKGHGMVVCTGRVTVSGTTHLESGTGVALLAGGQVSLQGTGSRGSYFQGLVYTDGGFTADQVSMVGPLVSRGTAPVRLTDAALLLPADLPDRWVVGGGDAVTEGNVKVTVPGTADWQPSVNVTRKGSDQIEVALHAEFQGQPVTRQATLDLGDRDQAAAQLAQLLAPPGGSPPTSVELPAQTGLPQLTIPDFLAHLAAPGPSVPAGGTYLLEVNQFYRLQDRLRQVLYLES